MNIFETASNIEKIIRRGAKVPFLFVQYKTKCVDSPTGYKTNNVIPFYAKNKEWLNAVADKYPFGCLCVPIGAIEGKLDIVEICAKNARLAKVDNNIQLSLKL